MAQLVDEPNFTVLSNLSPIFTALTERMDGYLHAEIEPNLIRGERIVRPFVAIMFLAHREATASPGPLREGYYGIVFKFGGRVKANNTMTAVVRTFTYKLRKDLREQFAGYSNQCISAMEMLSQEFRGNSIPSEARLLDYIDTNGGLHGLHQTWSNLRNKRDREALAAEKTKEDEFVAAQSLIRIQNLKREAKLLGLTLDEYLQQQIDEKTRIEQDERQKRNARILAALVSRARRMSDGMFAFKFDGNYYDLPDDLNEVVFSALHSVL